MNFLSKGNSEGKKVNEEEWEKEEERKEAAEQFIKQKAKKKEQRLKFENRIYSIRDCMNHYILNEDVYSVGAQGDFLKEFVSTLNEIYGITNEKLAEYWDINPKTLIEYINNEKEFGFDIIYKISDTFYTSPKVWLLIESKNKVIQAYNYIHQNILEDKSYCLEGVLGYGVL